MRLWVGVLALAASLVAGSAASAKSLQKIVAIGAHGASTELTGLDWGTWAESPARVSPKGQYVLLYPLMERGIPAQPGRYYPGLHVVCFSADRLFAGRCYGAPAALEAVLAGLPTVARPPAIVKKLVVSGKKRNDWSSGAVAIELAFNRPALAKAVPKPDRCRAVRVVWKGPMAASRPARFFACSGGLWAAGKLYPTGPLLF
jgi:hypothetical protein